MVEDGGWWMVVAVAATLASPPGRDNIAQSNIHIDIWGQGHGWQRSKLTFSGYESLLGLL